VTEPTLPIDYLSLNDLLEIAAGVIDRPVVHDVGLLASAAGPAADVDNLRQHVR